jgi:hypothetical protein
VLYENTKSVGLTADSLGDSDLAALLCRGSVRWMPRGGYMRVADFVGEEAY